MDASLPNEHGHLLDLSVYVNSRPEVAEEPGVALWAKLKSGSRAAFNEIFDAHVDALASYGSRLSRDSELVEDCIQDVFFELWTKRATISGEVKHVRFYLATALRRRILKRMEEDEKRLGQHDITLIPDIDSSHEEKIIQGQLSDEQTMNIQEALETLCSNQKEAVHLRFVQEMSYKQITEIMGIDLKSAYNLISKAILNLRTELSKKRHAGRRSAR